MINFQTFLFGLLAVSTLTGLMTEAVKKVFEEFEATYRSNIIAGVVAFAVSIAVGVGYIAIYAVPVNAQTMAYFVALVVLSWLCAMIGYDKVIQAINQFKTYKED